MSWKKDDVGSIVQEAGHILFQNGLEQSSTELSAAYDVKANGDHHREIQSTVTTPSPHDLHGWHLERLAVSHYATTTSSISPLIETLERMTSKLQDAIKEYAKEDLKWNLMEEQYREKATDIEHEIKAVKATLL